MVVRRGSSQAFGRRAGVARRLLPAELRSRPMASLLRGLQPATLLAGPVLPARAAAADDARHGLSTFGELKYKPDFSHFDWVNPSAPKGGRLALIGSGARTSFDTFNAFILRGDAAQGLEYLFDTLMARAFDEPD